MKTLNKNATKIFGKILNLIPEGEFYIKVDNSSSFMYLSVEKLYTTSFRGTSVDVYSMAHYYEQNGDLVPDPDVTFMVRRYEGLEGLELFVYPMEITNSFGYKKYLSEEDGKWSICKNGQADLAVFCGKWMTNIKYQQNIK